MIAHSISRFVPIILLEDETKVRSNVAWEPKYDTLAGFCSPKDNHVCQSGFKHAVGVGKDGYNVIVDALRNNKLGGFARIVVVNPLHESLLRLVLDVCSTCNFFDASWVRRQWKVIHSLWANECVHVFEPIIGHASNDDS